MVDVIFQLRRCAPHDGHMSMGGVESGKWKVESWNVNMEK